MLTRCPLKRLQGDGPFKMLQPCNVLLDVRGQGPDRVLACPTCNETWTTDGKEWPQ